MVFFAALREIVFQAWQLRVILLRRLRPFGCAQSLP
jgi:hypothetical protein